MKLGNDVARFACAMFASIILLSAVTQQRVQTDCVDHGCKGYAKFSADTTSQFQCSIRPDTFSVSFSGPGKCACTNNVCGVVAGSNFCTLSGTVTLLQDWESEEDEAKSYCSRRGAHVECVDWPNGYPAGGGESSNPILFSFAGQCGGSDAANVIQQFNEPCTGVGDCSGVPRCAVKITLTCRACDLSCAGFALTPPEDRPPPPPPRPQ
jgi:hypothetical protein